MRRPVAAVMAGCVLAIALWTACGAPHGSRPPGESAQALPPPGGPAPGMRPPGGMMPVATDSFAAERESLARVVLASIAGKENMPAESVFKSIKVMKKVPAGRLVNIMNMGFGRSLGARCRLCHIQDHWDAEDKENKQTARMMMAMSDTINRIFLSRIKHEDGSPATAACGTCHRGHPHPQRF